MKSGFKDFWKSSGHYFYPLVALIIVLVIFYNIDAPKMGEINVLRQELVTIQDRLAKLTAKSTVLTGVTEEKLRGDLERVNLVLPDGKDAPSIVRSIEYCSSTSSILVESFGFTPGKLATQTAIVSEERTNEIPLKASVTGKTTDLGNFLKLIASVGRAMAIRGLELRFTDPVRTDDGKIGLDLSAFFLLPPPFSGKVDEPLPNWGTKENSALSGVYSREVLSPEMIIPSTGKIDIFK
jgi:Tfp pilus assembly protein PilO